MIRPSTSGSYGGVPMRPQGESEMNSQEREQPVESGQWWVRRVDGSRARVREVVEPNSYMEYPATSRWGWIGLDSLRRMYRLEPRP